MSGGSGSCGSRSQLRCPPSFRWHASAGAGLRPRPNASRELVDASQRERLQGAMIAAVAARGFHGSTVDEIVELAGVSTKALYRHFGGKLNCFLDTYDLLVAAGTQRIAAVAGDDRKARAGRSPLRAALEELLMLPARRPDPAHVALLEVLSVGPEALPRIEHAQERFQALLRGCLAQEQVPAEPSPTLAIALAHGLWHVARMSMTGSREDRSEDGVAALAQWMLRCCEPAAAFSSPGRVDAAGERVSSPAPAGRGGEHEERMRVLVAAAEIAASQGYEAVSVPALSRCSDVSIDRVLSMFGDAEQCFLATIEMLSASLLAQALRDCESATDWERGCLLFIESILRRVVEDETVARVCFVEIFAAGASGAALRQRLLAGFADLLARRMPAGGPHNPLLAEAGVGAAWGAIHHHVVKGEPERLLQLTGEIAGVLFACGDHATPVRRPGAGSPPASGGRKHEAS